MGLNMLVIMEGVHLPLPPIWAAFPKRAASLSLASFTSYSTSISSFAYNYLITITFIYSNIYVKPMPLGGSVILI